MLSRMPYAVILLVTLLTFSCSKTDNGRDFYSVVNQRSEFDANFAFSIDSLRDYRCPSDVVCVWAGDVDIFLKFFLSSGIIDTMMNLNNDARNPVIIDGYTIRVKDVLPYPVSTRKTALEDYKINLEIIKK